MKKKLHQWQRKYKMKFQNEGEQEDTNVTSKALGLFKTRKRSKFRGGPQQEDQTYTKKNGGTVQKRKAKSELRNKGQVKKVRIAFGSQYK